MRATEINENSVCQCSWDGTKYDPDLEHCDKPATMILYKNWEDIDGTMFCDTCGFQALDSGEYFEADDLGCQTTVIQ